MAVNISQISDLVQKLWTRTQSGSITWEQLGHQNGFQARLGDFVIIVSRPFRAAGISSSAGADIDLVVKRLDGKTIYSTQSSINALGGSLLNALSGTHLPTETRNILRQMYSYLSNRDTDLDELLKLL